MRKATLLLVLSFVLFVTRMNADIVTDWTRIHVQIMNMSDFPTMALVSVYNCGNAKNSTMLIESSELPNARESCPMSFYVVEKKYLKKVEFDKIDWQKDKNVQKINLITEANVFFSNDYSDVKIVFKIARKKNTYYVYKSKVTYKYRAKGTQQAPSDLVKNFNDDVVDLFDPIYVSKKLL